MLEEQRRQADRGVEGRVISVSPSLRGVPSGRNDGGAKSLRIEIPGLRRRQRARIRSGRVLDRSAASGRGNREPRTKTVLPSMPTSLTIRGAQRVWPLWRAQRKCAARRFVVLRTLQHQIAARQVQPVRSLRDWVEVDPLQRRHPWFENLEPADRAIMAPCRGTSRREVQARTDAADEYQPGIARRRHLDGQLSFADLTFSGPCLNPVKYFGP